MKSNDNQVYDLIIVGAGPAGMEAAIQAQKCGLKYLLLEKKYVGSLIRDTMALKKFYHVYGRNTATIRGDLQFPDRIQGDELVRLWHQQAENLCIQFDTVQKITPVENHFTLTSPTKSYLAKKIILTCGTFESPQKLHVPGEAEHPNVSYTLDYYNDYEGKTIIVVGGGNSALETAIYHAEHNKIILVVRKDHFASSVTPNNQSAVETMVAEGKIEVWWQSTIVAIDRQVAIVAHNGREEIKPFDLLFIHIGYEKPLEFLKSAGIEIEESLGGVKPKFNEKFETNVPGLFLSGALTGADSVIESANQAFDIVHLISDCELRNVP